MKNLFLATIVAGAALAVTAEATLVNTFDDNAAYDQNFWEVVNGSAASRNAGGFVRATGTTVLIYDSAATGGSGGAGGTAGFNTDKFDRLITSTDFRVMASGISGANLGMYFKVNDAETSGYLAIWDFNADTTTARLRLWDSNANPSGAGTGTPLISGQNFTTTGSFATNTYYRAFADVRDVGSNVQFTFKLLDTANNQIGNTITFTDTTSPVTGPGQLGLRLVNWTDIDNFTIIPEPSTMLLLSVGGGLLWSWRRRK